MALEAARQVEGGEAMSDEILPQGVGVATERVGLAVVTRKDAHDAVNMMPDDEEIVVVYEGRERKVETKREAHRAVEEVLRGG